MSKDFDYYTNEKGREVPRVHSILQILGVNQLLMWANFIGLQGVKYKKELQRTANVGTMFHEVVELALKGDEVKLDYDKFDVKDALSKREFKNCLNSFFAWYQDNKDFFFVDKYDVCIVGDDFGGTLDLVIKGVKNKKAKIIVDLKTSSLFTLAMFLQLAAYVVLYEDKFPKEKIEGVMIIRADKKFGEIAKTKFLTREEIEPYINLFKLLVQVHNSMNIAEEFLKIKKRSFTSWCMKGE